MCRRGAPREFVRISQFFLLEPPDFLADFVAGTFFSFLWERVHRKNPPGNSPAKSSKIYTTKIPDTFLQRDGSVAGPKFERHSEVFWACYTQPRAWGVFFLLRGSCSRHMSTTQKIKTRNCGAPAILVPVWVVLWHQTDGFQNRKFSGLSKLAIKLFWCTSNFGTRLGVSEHCDNSRMLLPYHWGQNYYIT